MLNPIHRLSSIAKSFRRNGGWKSSEPKSLGPQDEKDLGPTERAQSMRSRMPSSTRFRLRRSSSLAKSSKVDGTGGLGGVATVSTSSSS